MDRHISPANCAALVACSDPSTATNIRLNIFHLHPSSIYYQYSEKSQPVQAALIFFSPMIRRIFVGWKKSFFLVKSKYTQRFRLYLFLKEYNEFEVQLILEIGMHIAHFTNTYKPNINGVVRSVSTFRNTLTQMGHNVFIFSQDTQEYEDEEAFVFRYPSLSIPTVDYSFSIPVSPFIDWLLPSLKLDIIHSNHPVLLGYAAADKAEKFNIPLVFTFHTRYEEYSHYIPFSQAFVKEIIVDWLLRYMERCQHIVTPSESIRQMLIKYSGLHDHITTIPTGIELKPFHEATGASIRHKLNWGKEQIIVSIGRLAAEKNWKTLIAACALAMQSNQNIRLILIGDGPQKEELKKYAKELGVTDKVVFTGLVPFDQIPKYLKAADLFCF
ncbi:MAG: glycosyltransferase, partial [Actinomycetota bacterium]